MKCKHLTSNHRRVNMVFVKFELPINIMVVGPSQAGKSHFIQKLILNSKDMFKQPVGRVIYSYSVWSKSFEPLEKLDFVEFTKTIPTSEELVDYWEANEKYTILVLDDLMHSVTKEISKLFCVTSHHAGLGILYSCQNLFSQNKYQRELSLNTHVFCLFKNKRNSLQIRTLSSQIFPGKVDFVMDAYRQAIKEEYSFLVIDLKGPEKYSLRSNIFPSETTRVYLPKNGI